MAIIMQLTSKQEQGLKIALERYKNHEKYTTIAGYAGTGKSTLVKFIIAALNVAESAVVFATYTGKAAEVLRKKGNKNAMTLHKLLYESYPKPGGGFGHRPKPELEYTIVVVDEISMAPKSMLDMLMKHNAYIIMLGDPFQLPQIDKGEEHDFLDHPHIFLDEVMRQAAESEIIRLTMDIRAGKELDLYNGNEMKIISSKDLVTGHLLWADQILCATNTTRVGINKQMRELLGYGGLPQDGEKMICLRNYWDILSSNQEAALVNGTTGIIHNPYESFVEIPRQVRSQVRRMDNIICSFDSDAGNEFTEVDMDKKLIVEGTTACDWRDSYKIGKAHFGHLIPKEFDFGYAITCWKAQGSEWNKVLAFEENFPFQKMEHNRYLYTACTRAASRLVLVKHSLG